MQTAEAGPADIDRAVTAARAAFPAWGDTPAAERGRLLLEMADAIEADAAALARLESLDTADVHQLEDGAGTGRREHRVAKSPSTRAAR